MKLVTWLILACEASTIKIIPLILMSELVVF